MGEWGMTAGDGLRRCAEANQRHQERIAELERTLAVRDGRIAGLEHELSIEHRDRHALTSMVVSLREIARAVAEHDPFYPSAHGGFRCHHCGAWSDLGNAHNSACEWVQARKLLGEAVADAR